MTDIQFSSNSAVISSTQLADIHQNLMNASAIYRTRIEDITNSGHVVTVVLDSSFPGREAQETVRGGIGRDDVYISLDLLRGAYYSAGHSETIERVLAHELGGHVWQDTQELRVDPLLPYNRDTNSLYNSPLAEYGHPFSALTAENDIMFQAFGETPDDYYGYLPLTYGSAIHYYDANGNPVAIGGDGNGPLKDLSDLLTTIKTLFGIAGHSSPLVLDLNGNGVTTTSLHGDHAVYFDHNHDGDAEASGWVGSGDGVLAIDLNGDGIINSGAELFGNQNGAANGFVALAAYDSNGDGKIDANDAQFGNLKVWVDANGDGYSQSLELKTLSDLGISQINLAYSTTNATDAQGNLVGQSGSFVMDGNTHTVADIYFAVDKVNTVFNQDYTLDTRVLFLPVLRGYGLLPDLHIAMSQDSVLLDKVSTFSTLSFADAFTSSTAVTETVRSIMFRWAGVEAIAPNQSGYANYADDRETAFLEHLTGNLNPTWLFGLPTGCAEQMLNQAFDDAMGGFYARLLAQGSGKQLFTGDVQYNLASDTLSGITGLDAARLNDLQTEAAGLSNTAERSSFWGNVVRMIEYGIGTDHLTAANRTALDNAIHSDTSLSLAGIKTELVESSLILNGFGVKMQMTGTAGDDVMYGTTGNDTIQAGNGNDLIVGRDGNDILIGNSGNDVYIYHHGDGNDTIADDYGADTIRFGEGITLGDLTLTRLSDTNAQLTLGGEWPGQIVILSQFTGQSIETLQFADGSATNLLTMNYNTYGSAAADTIHGVTQNGGHDDTLYGLGGDDSLYGDEGNDVITGGAGNDLIDGGNGYDIAKWDAAISGFSFAFGSGHDVTVTSSSGTWGVDSLTNVEEFRFSDLSLTYDALYARVNTPTPTGETVVLAINAGVGAFTTAAGVHYIADAYGTGNATLDYSNLPIANTTDDAVYQSQRYSWNGFDYHIPVANGDYKVALQFAEEFHTDASGARLMNIDAEGGRVISGLNVFAEAGYATALDKMINVHVADGMLDLHFGAAPGAGDDNPVINGIVISTAGGITPQSGPTGVELVVNGGFEADSAAANGNWQVYPNGLTGWGTSIGMGAEVQDHVFTPFAGDKYVELAGYNSSNLYQDIATSGNGTFHLEFAYTGRPGFDATTNQVEVLWNGQHLDTLTGTTLDWQLHGYDVQGAGNTTRLEFRAIGPDDGVSGFIDAVSVKGTGGMTTPEDHVVLAINAGGDAYDTSNGIHYIADAYNNGNAALDNPNMAIGNTNDDAVYQSQRYSWNGFDYHIPVDNGDYKVTLQFAEEFHSNSSGARLMNIDAEGTRAISNLNVFQEAGYATALDKVVNVHITDGFLDLHFGAAANAGDDNPIINGIVISTSGNSSNAFSVGDLLMTHADAGPTGNAFIMPQADNNFVISHLDEHGALVA